MTLAEIIAEIDEKYQNGIGNESKVRKMNILQKKLFRKMKKQTFVDYEITADQPQYPLVMNIDDVFQVLIDGKEIPDKKIADTSSSCAKYYAFVGTKTGDWIDIHPTPIQDGTLTIWHYEVPDQLDTVDLNKSPQLDPDYHMLFVYYVCKEIAENYRDFDIANGFAIQYNQLEREMMASFQDPEVILVHSESGW